ncbi:hypothetical protein TNCV_1944121 [Trichonephila clavipes]|nr:hypothetical protein TNCV_1944121 [Trichonephila clavipes]
MLQDYDTSFSRVYFSRPRLFSSPVTSLVPTSFSSVVARSFSLSSLVRPVASDGVLAYRASTPQARVPFLGRARLTQPFIPTAVGQ